MSLPAQPDFSPDALLQALTELAPGSDAHAHEFVCAVSGGQDSMALAHALAQLPLRARAVYVDHSLHHDSAAWGQKVTAALASHGMRTTCLAVSVPAGANLESRAREARYAVLAQALTPGAVLLTAHHQEDQALTVLLQLLRGAGVAGLAAMPARAAFGPGEHWRPVLSLPAAALMAYAQRAGLDPVVDPSNNDRRFDRNFLRHEIAPRLAQRWPAYARTLSRSAAHCAQALNLMDELGAPTMCDDAVWLGPTLSGAAAASALRLFLRERGIRTPAAARLDEFLRQLRDGRADSHPSLPVEGATLRRYGHWVFAVEEPLHSAAFDVTLVPGQCVELPGVAGRVCFEPDAASPAPLRVRSRRGGERFGPTPSVRLKHFLHERGVLPWRRASVPLVYRGDELVAVGDWWRSSQLPGRIRWDRPTAFEAPAAPPV